MEELIRMAKDFREAAFGGESLGLQDDELAFYDALSNNESAAANSEARSSERSLSSLLRSFALLSQSTGPFANLSGRDSG